jgi:hypothetical protein
MNQYSWRLIRLSARPILWGRVVEVSMQRLPGTVGLHTLGMSPRDSEQRGMRLRN